LYSIDSGAVRTPDCHSGVLHVWSLSSYSHKTPNLMLPEMKRSYEDMKNDHEGWSTEAMVRLLFVLSIALI
jgi:hypothetical protein